MLAKLDRLIADLRRSLQLLETDLQLEERTARILDVSDPTYPTTARALRLRRDNLAGTINTLEAKCHGLKRAAERSSYAV
jgi:hypothetical protein